MKLILASKIGDQGRVADQSEASRGPAAVKSSKHYVARRRGQVSHPSRLEPWPLVFKHSCWKAAAAEKYIRTNGEAFSAVPSSVEVILVRRRPGNNHTDSPSRGASGTNIEQLNGPGLHFFNSRHGLLWLLSKGLSGKSASEGLSPHNWPGQGCHYLCITHLEPL